jgi:arylsulfatase A-like enzyme
MKCKPVALLLVVLIVAASCQVSAPKQVDPPHIIFIMTDDHAFQAISAYGSILMKTPHIDRLAAEGMRFDQAFVTNSICAPSRAVALTGKFSHLNGVKDNADVFDSSQLTFPKILRSHGYQTAVIGKWHLKSIPSGFDYWRVLIDQGDYFHPEFITPGGVVKEAGYVTDVVTDLSIGYLDSLRDKSRPFMLMYHHKAPHRHWWPSVEDLEAFKHQPIPEPATLFDDYRNRGRAAKEAEMRIRDHMALSADNKIDPEILKKLNLDEFLFWYEDNYRREYDRLTAEEKVKWDAIYGPINADFENNPPEGNALTYWKYQRYMQDYLGTIKSVDDNIGRLLDYLDSTGLSENTLVIYTSDQGFYLGEHGWFDKRFMYEPSFRTPLIIRWPGRVPANSVNTDLVQNIDFAPTILSAAGIPAPPEMQGMSLLPVFEGKRNAWRDALYYHYYEFPNIHMVKRHYGIRTERYKLIHFYYDVDEWELYDLQQDPDELNNVYADDAYREIQLKLKQQLAELQILYQDPDELRIEMLESDLARFKNQ